MLPTTSVNTRISSCDFGTAHGIVANPNIPINFLNPDFNIQSNLQISLININFYSCNPVSISLYTMLGVFPSSTSFSNTFSLFPDVHLDNPTYN